MGTRTTKSNFFKTIAEEALQFSSQLGFVYREHGVFWRTVGAVDHGFFLVPNPTPTHFHVEVGAFVPALEKRLDYVRGSHCVTLVVSRPLGLLQCSARDERALYHFATVEELRDVFRKMHADFVEQAEPWLTELVTIDDVAKEFHKWRIAERSPGIGRPPDPFAWAIYGWLLQEAGRTLEGRPWLDRALVQLKEPAFCTKGGHLVPTGTPGARAVPRTPEERRLIQVLKKDLELG